MKLPVGSLLLRPFRRSDRGAYVHLRKENSAWLDHWEARDPALPTDLNGYHYRAFFRSIMASHRHGSAISLAITLNREIVGHIHYSPLQWGAGSNANVGYWVSREFAGQGIATNALRAANTHMIQELKFHRIEALIQAHNGASRAVATKLQMRHEGSRDRCLYVAGQWRAHEVYALTAEDLQQRPAVDSHKP